MVTHLEGMKKELQRSEEELERKEETGEAVSERSIHSLSFYKPINLSAYD